MRSIAILLACASCGRLGFGSETVDAAPPVEDASDATVDAMIDVAPPTDPFGTPVTVMALGGGGVDDPALTDDELMIVFNSSRAGGVGMGDIYQATRASTADPFGMVTNEMALNTTVDDATPALSPDGLAIYYVTVGSLGEKDVFIATRATRTSAWGAPAEQTVLSSGGDEAGPALTPDQLAIYYASDRTGTDEIYASSRAAIGAPWSAPQHLAELGTPASDGEPWIDPSQTTIVFASDRGGNFDLYVARRTTSTVPFDAPEPIAELNTAADETDPWLSADQRTIYFARNNVIVRAER